MRDKLRAFAYALFVSSFAFSHHGVAQSSKAPTVEASNLLHSLRGRDPQISDESKEALVRQREAIIKSLIELAESDPREQRLVLAKQKAVELLGAYRAAEAAAVLVNQISYEAPFAINREPHPLNGYPAAIALTNIGNPSVRAVLGRLGKEPPLTEKHMRLFSYVLVQIDGKEVALCRLRLALAEHKKDYDGRPTSFGERLALLISATEMIGTRHADDAHWRREGRD